MSDTLQALKKQKELPPKTGGRGTRDKNKPRNKVVRITSDLFNEMSESELGRKFNVDFHDICSEVWEFWKEHHRDDNDDNS